MGEKQMKFTPGQIKTTKALLMFCKLHGHSQFWVEQLSECLTALEEKDTVRVTETHHMLRRAGMGSFMDWCPRAVSNDENDEYTETIWQALLGLWLEMMRPFKQKVNA